MVHVIAYVVNKKLNTYDCCVDGGDMVKNNVLIFGQDSFFCKNVSDIMLEKNIMCSHVKNYRQFFTQIVSETPSLVIVTDDILDCERKRELFKIKCYALGVRVLLFTDGGVDFSISKDLSVVDKKNPLTIYGTIIDLFCAGYRLTDSQVVPDKKLNVQKVLSPRENTILSMMTGGLSVRDISKQLKIKEKTIMTYKRRFFAKLGVRKLRDCIIP